jgi:HlyD family secretion protein
MKNGMELLPKEWSDKILPDYLCRVSTRSKVIYWIIIVIIITALLSLPLIYVDVAVRSRGFFQSGIERQPILAPCSGKVVYTAIISGKSVSLGDTLMIIGSEALSAELASVEQRVTENASAIIDLKQLLSVRLSETRLSSVSPGTQRYLAEYTSLARLIELQAQSFYKTKSDYIRTQKLHDQKVISDSEYEASYFAFKSEQQNLAQVMAQTLSRWELDLAQRINDSIILKAELLRCNEELKNRIVIAPLGGEILQSSDIQTGAFVYNNQHIAEISPDGEIVGICYVPPEDIGLIKTGLQVVIQVDALKYTEWGLLDAWISDISDDLIVDEGQSAYFRVECKPVKNYLSLKNSVIAELKKGMTFNARIVVAKRNLLNLLFDKMDDWFNPYKN